MIKELKEIDAPYIMAKSVRDFYLPLNKELEELVQVKTPDLVENYNHLTTAQKNKLYSFIGKIISDVENYMSTKKAARAIRKPKVKSADKQITRLQYNKESSNYQIASINPLTIVGATRLFTFNIKHKIIKELVSNSVKGFQVSGSTLKNFDDSISRETVLRNPESFLPIILNQSKKQIDKAWDNLTTKTRKTNSRINKDVILLRSMDK